MQHRRQNMHLVNPIIEVDQLNHLVPTTTVFLFPLTSDNILVPNHHLDAQQETLIKSS